jgi:glucose-6-phosphate-specific signal transduction histidine kinase
VLSLEVSDNGRGLSRADLAKARSFGIRGLHERAGTVGGWVDLSSGAGRHHADPVGAAGAPMRRPADRRAPTH